jgi:hypothetical protein
MGQPGRRSGLGLALIQSLRRGHYELATEPHACDESPSCSPHSPKSDPPEAWQGISPALDQATQ